MKYEELPQELPAVISPDGLKSDHFELLRNVWNQEDEEGRKDLVEQFRSAGTLERDSLILRLSHRLLH